MLRTHRTYDLDLEKELSMCVSGVHHLAKNAYTKTQPKESGLAKSSSETDSSVGEINQRTAEMMPLALEKYSPIPKCGWE
jgi:hypothetical protein